MSEMHSSEQDSSQASRQETMAALFANLVIQQTNMALMLLGQVPNPETGERVQNLDAARMFIDQLEMLEVKTKGNLDKREDQLLKQSLTTLRMAFVEAVESAPSADAKTAPSKAASQPPASTSSEPTAPTLGSPPSGPADDEHRKKFSKKY
jgi:Domain of unknown function (DUF1844)